MSNVMKHYISSGLWVTVNTFTAGAVLQTFLMEHGFSEELTNIITASGQIISLVVMLLFSPVSDRIRNVIKATAGTYLLYLPILFVLLTVCLQGRITPLTTVLLFLTIGLYSCSGGLQNSLTYKLPFVTLDMRMYGRVTSIGGIVTGVIGLLLSVALTYLQESLGYRSAMTGIFTLCVPLLIIVYFVVVTMKPIADAPTANKIKAKPINYFRFKPFSQLIAANLLRGFGTGILNVVVTIGYFCNCIDAKSAAYVVLISNLTTFLGAGLYSVVTGKLPEKLIILVASIGIFASVPFMVVGSNTLTFLIFYGIATFFWTAINYSIPVAVVQIADYSVMGQYSSGRLLLHTLGSSLAGFICIKLIEWFGAIPTMTFTGVCFLLCGVSYFVYMKKNKLR